MLNKSIATSAMTIGAMSLVLALSACSKKDDKAATTTASATTTTTTSTSTTTAPVVASQATSSAPASAAVTPLLRQPRQLSPRQRLQKKPPTLAAPLQLPPIMPRLQHPILP